MSRISKGDGADEWANALTSASSTSGHLVPRENTYLKPTYCILYIAVVCFDAL
jgi:hypothetical protein